MLKISQTQLTRLLCTFKLNTIKYKLGNNFKDKQIVRLTNQIFLPLAHPQTFISEIFCLKYISLIFKISHTQTRALYGITWLDRCLCCCMCKVANMTLSLHDQMCLPANKCDCTNNLNNALMYSYWNLHVHVCTLMLTICIGTSSLSRQ